MSIFECCCSVLLLRPWLTSPAQTEPWIPRRASRLQLYGFCGVCCMHVAAGTELGEANLGSISPGRFLSALLVPCLFLYSFPLWIAKHKNHDLLLSCKGAFGTGDPREEDCGRYEADAADASNTGHQKGCPNFRTPHWSGTNGSSCQRTLAFGAALTNQQENAEQENGSRWKCEVKQQSPLHHYTAGLLRKNMSPMINDLDPLHSPRRLQMMEDMKTLSLGTWNNFWTCFVSHGLRTQGLDENGDTQATNPSIFSRQFSCVEATGGSSTGQVSKGLGHGMEWRRPIYAVHTSFAYHCQSMMSMLDSFSYSLPSKLPIYLLTYIAS